MKNIKLFSTEQEQLDTVLDPTYVAYNEESGLVYTNHNGGSNDNEVDYSTEYLTFVALEDSIFNLTRNACEYSLDEANTWVSLPAGTNTPTVYAGNNIMFKCTNPSISSSNGIGYFSSTGKFNVEGNAMSMLYGDDFVDKNDLTGKDYAIYRMFSGCTNVVEAHNLALPATTLSSHCYREMFYKCTSLITAPKLPATILVNSCYRGMFQNCTSLTTAPDLPATTLANYSYGYMFQNCTSLTTVPSILPATTLANSCCRYMFDGCTSLTTAPELPATKLATECYYYMFYGCNKLNNILMLATNISASKCLDYWVKNVSSTGTFVKHPDMTSLPTGINGIPEGWTVEDAVL